MEEIIGIGYGEIPSVPDIKPSLENVISGLKNVTKMLNVKSFMPVKRKGQKSFSCVRIYHQSAAVRAKAASQIIITSEIAFAVHGL